ncbi:MAG: SDR family oxidoreductase, partial [Planctomycetaceae bacterium]|nr:SDR family oxidoreductase [Planctomycetaceae bacterium]
MNRFEDTVAIITGPSDQGIGGAIAERLAQEGASLFLFGPERPRRLLKRLERRHVDVIWYTGDVTSTVDVENAIETCHEEYGRIDVLVNNAGVEFCKPLDEILDEEWDHLLGVNLTG